MAVAVGMMFDYRSMPPSAVADCAQRCEAAGIDQLWVVKDCFWSASVSLAAAALASTESLRVGIGVMSADEMGAFGTIDDAHHHYGRPLSDILRAPWAASRAIVRFTHDRAAAVGLSPAAAQEIAEVVIDWSDRISIAFSEGYNDETAARAGELETRRQHVLRLALADTPPAPGAVAEAARAAEWPFAPRVRVLVAAGLDRDEYRRRLPAGGLAAEIDDALCAIIPEHADTSRLANHLPAGDRIAALGPPTPLTDAHRSARLAQRAIALARRSPGDALAGPDADRESDTASSGLLGHSAPGAAQPSSALIDCSTIELGLVVLADHTSAVEFSRRRLAPVLDKPKLIDTLDAWLATHGRPKAAAAHLGVHPHTVSYRLERLRDHLGTIVDDPDRRLELHLATYVVRNGSPG